ncbi:MAG: chitinase [Lachnospiraceae bacterium]|nr:chitinase [Lachnospiraceae bacterium]
MDNERLMERRRRRRKRKLQKLIPGTVAIFLIAVVAFVGWKTGLFESFMYSSEKADLFSYFGAIGDDYAVLIKDGEITTEQYKVTNGHIYVDLDTVKDTFNDRFYYDQNDNALLYTTATEVIRVPIGASGYQTEAGAVENPYTICMEEAGDILVALDYVQLYADFSFELFGGNGEPYRARIITEGATVPTATIMKEQAVRTDEDKKSSILKEMYEGDVVTVLEEGDSWTKVQTQDLIIGYYENRFLDNFGSEVIPDPPKHSEPEMTHISKDYPIRMIWDMVTNTDANKGLKDRLSGQQGLTTVSPTWFLLTDSDGNMESFASKDYVDTAHSMGLEVWGLVENMTHEDNVNTFEIFSYSQKRAYVIDQLMQYAADYDLDGINIDFEAMLPETGEHFAQFIRELSIACRKAGIVLSVDNYAPSPSTSHYYRDQQGIYADYVIIMGYDEHYNGSEESGSVSSLNFVIDGIVNTMEEVPAERIINAVPFYTRVWIETPKSDAEIAAESRNKDATDEFVPFKLDVRTLGMTDAIQYVADAGVTPKWDEETAQNYAEWESGGRTYKVWLEDGKSLDAKVQAMQSYHLPGIAAWQLTYACPEAWGALAKFQ